MNLRILLILPFLCALGCHSHAPAPTTEAAQAGLPASVEKPLPYALRQGRATFQHYCMTCHGEAGAGDGFNAFNIEPHPRDLSDPTFQKTKSDADLAETVRRGGAGMGLSPLMPPWGRTLTSDQIDEVVAYVRTLKRSGP